MIQEALELIKLIKLNFQHPMLSEAAESLRQQIYLNQKEFARLAYERMQEQYDSHQRNELTGIEEHCDDLEAIMTTALLEKFPAVCEDLCIPVTSTTIENGEEFKNKEWRKMKEYAHSSLLAYWSGRYDHSVRGRQPFPVTDFVIVDRSALEERLDFALHCLEKIKIGICESERSRLVLAIQALQALKAQDTCEEENNEPNKGEKGNV